MDVRKSTVTLEVQGLEERDAPAHIGKAPGFVRRPIYKTALVRTITWGARAARFAGGAISGFIDWARPETAHAPAACAYPSGSGSIIVPCYPPR